MVSTNGITPQEAVEAIRDILFKYLPDSNQDRAKRKLMWIYPDEPIATNPAEYPRIWIEDDETAIERLTISDSGYKEHNVTSIKIHFLTHPENEYTENGELYTKESLCRLYLTKIHEVLKEHIDELQDLGIRTIFPGYFSRQIAGRLYVRYYQCRVQIA